MSIDEMVREISQETKEFAALAFQKIDKNSFGHKIAQLIDGKKYGLFKFGIVSKLTAAERVQPPVAVSPDSAKAFDARTAIISISRDTLAVKAGDDRARPTWSPSRWFRN